MRQPLEEGLRTLIELLGQMEHEVENILNGAITSLKALDRNQAERWISADEYVNSLESKVNEECIRLIVTQQPVASDMRKIISAMKIATDLERMGDLAVDIAKVVKRIDGPLIKPLIDVPKMADLATRMMRQGLIAFEREDAVLAQELADLDDQTDQLNRTVMVELLGMMTYEPRMINQGMYLSFVARYIERIADHATNIGEHVFYVVKGERKDLND